jgi:hypothetical protein
MLCTNKLKLKLKLEKDKLNLHNGNLSHVYFVLSFFVVRLNCLGLTAHFRSKNQLSVNN